MLGDQVLVQAALLVLGGIWCKEVLGRIRVDIAEVRGHAQWTDRAPTIAIWVVTAGIGVWMVSMAWSISAGLLAWV